MSTFSVPIVKIKNILPIPDADSIDVAEVLGYRCVVRRGEFQPGQLVAYIPEDSIVSENVLFQLGLLGKLAGGNKNRVKAVKLRGVVSQGLLLAVTSDPSGNYLSYTDPESGVDDYLSVSEGDEVSTFLCITKWSPPVPVFMAGEVCNMRGHTIKYDIENIQRYPDILVEGEEVVYTEKLHGTFCGLSYVPDINNIELYENRAFAFSKGLGGQGLVFKHNEKNANNVYHRLLFKYFDHIKYLSVEFNSPVTVLGEIYGKGIQDLTYGTLTPEFRVFDIFVGNTRDGRYLNYDEMIHKCAGLFTTVPTVYRGPYSKESELDFRSGRDLISNTNIREGVVIKPVSERFDSILGRVILKSVSPEYLLRKGNTTEYQ